MAGVTPTATTTTPGSPSEVGIWRRTWRRSRHSRPQPPCPAPDDRLSRTPLTLDIRLLRPCWKVTCTFAACALHTLQRMWSDWNERVRAFLTGRVTKGC